MRINYFLLIFYLFSCITLAQNFIQIDSLNEARIGHAMVVLSNGNILVSGGEGGYENSIKSSAEIFELSTGKWRYTHSMNVPRVSHNLILLKNGKVLAIGGFKEKSCELFDPDTETWTMTDSTPNYRILGQTVTELKDGRILVSGGNTGAIGDSILLTKVVFECDIFDPVTEKWSSVANLNIPRWMHSSVLLNDGRVLVMGGVSEEMRSCEIYDPIKNTWTITTSMIEPRSSLSSILLPNGNVFISGGDSIGVNIMPWKKSCEVFDITTEKWKYVADMLDFRRGHKTYLLPDSNRLLIFGGAVLQSTYEDTWEYYDLTVMKPIQKGIFPIKLRYEGNSLQLNDGSIILIGGEEFEISQGGLPYLWPTSKCYILNITTGIDDYETLPNKYILYQNYPNPFNPITTIKYSVPVTGHISLKVYDTLGSEVATLVNGIKSPGNYSVSFDGSKLSSGVYFYYFTAGKFLQTRKMIMIK